MRRLARVVTFSVLLAASSCASQKDTFNTAEIHECWADRPPIIHKSDDYRVTVQCGGFFNDATNQIPEIGSGLWLNLEWH